MSRHQILLIEGMVREAYTALVSEFDRCEFLDGRKPEVMEQHLSRAEVVYGAPPPDRLQDAVALQWIQLFTAGVPPELCAAAHRRGLTVTNLAGLYGPGMAEHTLAMMVLLARNLHTALWNQRERKWDRNVAQSMTDLREKTVAIIGAGNIGQCIGQLARAYGMRVLGCRRTPRSTPYMDRLYTLDDLQAMLSEADYVVMAAPLTAETKEMLGAAEFAAMKRGAIFVNISRGAVTKEVALLEALRSGHVAAAALDVFSVEPLPAEHPFWTMPQVIVTPHYSGDTVNRSALPVERLARNLRAWLGGGALEGVVNLELGY